MFRSTEKKDSAAKRSVLNEAKKKGKMEQFGVVDLGDEINNIVKESEKVKLREQKELEKLSQKQKKKEVLSTSVQQPNKPIADCREVDLPLPYIEQGLDTTDLVVPYIEEDEELGFGMADFLLPSNKEEEEMEFSATEEVGFSAIKIDGDEQATHSEEKAGESTNKTDKDQTTKSKPKKGKKRGKGKNKTKTK